MRVSCPCCAPSAPGVTAIHPVTPAHRGEQHDRMTCEHLVELVTDYLEGALSARDRERFEEHIDECPMCQDHLDRMRGVINQLGRLHERDLDPRVLAELQARFAAWGSGV